MSVHRVVEAVEPQSDVIADPVDVGMQNDMSVVPEPVGMDVLRVTFGGSSRSFTTFLNWVGFFIIGICSWKSVL